MQWLIDIVNELIGELPLLRERLPAPVNPDFDTVDLAVNGWQVRDVSHLVPEGTEAIILRANFEASASGRQLYMSKQSQVAWASMAFCRTIYANRQNFHDKIVYLSNTRTFKTNVNSTSWTTLTLTVIGWYGPAS